jgi:hypothetical protein
LILFIRKYFAWVEQRRKTVEVLNEQWQPEYWEEMFTGEITAFAKLNADFNRDVKL